MAKVADETVAATPVSGNVAIVIALLIGFVLVPWTARNVNATMVNGFLLLVLIGTVLGNTNRWLPYVAQIGAAFGSGSVIKKG